MPLARGDADQATIRSAIGGWVLNSAASDIPVHGLTMNSGETAGLTGSGICFE